MNHLELDRLELELEHEKLLVEIPEWRDEKAAHAEKEAIVKDIKARGFTDRWISKIDDHRIVLLARDAMLFRLMIGESGQSNV